ncbi:MAG: SRPBCC family protein [Gammaproteobacteria bacterium]|nr:SRPBCC family protein [Gammaproteobacteria bacterium]MDE2345566.1 SRPBCC family protein [Gammaproteobacteria bacterium]
MTLLAGNARAVHFNSLHVRYHDGRYQVSADVYLEAPLPQVYQVLTDFNHLNRIGGVIRQSHLLQQLDAHTYIVFVKSHGCVLFFCHSIRQTQRVVELTSQDLIAEAIPGKSDVTMGSSSWHLDTQKGGTRLHWQVTVQPDFWIPPLIGPPLVESALGEQGRKMAAGLEKLARERAHLPPLVIAAKHAATC